MVKHLKHNYRTILATILVVTLFFMVFLSFRNYKVEKFADSKKVRIVLVHANWCPHCTRYIDSGVYEKAKRLAAQNAELKDKVVFESVEHGADKARVENLRVSGFPSILATADVNGKESVLMDFSDFRSKDGRANRDNPEHLLLFAKDAVAQVN